MSENFVYGLERFAIALTGAAPRAPFRLNKAIAPLSL
jgi:hypothetical protein